MLKLFCKHKYIANGYVTEPIGNGHYRRRTIWKCTKCGKERLGEKTWGKEKKVKKKSKWDRVCERCGNEVFSPKKIYRCPYCDWKNGLK